MTALDARVRVTHADFTLRVDLALEGGEVAALMGPSGAGKSTLLGALAGLVPLDDGEIRVGGRMLDSTSAPKVTTEPARRGTVLLGQEPRLFPHLDVRSNVAFGLRVRGAGRDRSRELADQWLVRVGLDGFGHRGPAALSGGQQQRAALARALATEPAVLLLDEPLSSLDVETAGDIRALLHDQLRATGTTAIIATHAAVDAVSLAERLVVLEAGAITQDGPVRDVLAAPATRFGASVAGLNLVVGESVNGFWRTGPLVLPHPASAGADPVEEAALFRPSDVHIVAGDARRDAPWRARVVRLESMPAGVRLRVRTSGSASESKRPASDAEIDVDTTADAVAGVQPGDELTLHVHPSAVRFTPAPPVP